jgi:hypothetical protein
MSEKLSIIKLQEELDKGGARAEAIGAFATALANYVPKIGPLLAEAISVSIPQQKLERLIIFTQVLGDRVKYLETDLLVQKAKTQEFADLFEDALHQASRALSDERRQHIASLLTNSLTSDELAHVEQKKLLALLDDLNDAEIQLLKYYSLQGTEQHEFTEQHSELFTPISRTFGTPQINLDKGALRDSYRNKLIEVGLLRPVFNKPAKGTVPEFDDNTGRLKSTSHTATPLGRLLLRYIDEVSDAKSESKDTKKT